jgi:hypothetical protein
VASRDETALDERMREGPRLVKLNGKNIPLVYASKKDYSLWGQSTISSKTEKRQTQKKEIDLHIFQVGVEDG